jgi:Tfp pilus assembly protein PilF
MHSAKPRGAGAATAVLAGLFVGIVFSCGSAWPSHTETAIEPSPRQGTGRPAEGGVAAEIRALAEKGSPDSLQAGLEMIRSRELGGTDFGRTMNLVMATLTKKLYPNPNVRVPSLDPTQTHTYTKIIRDAERGVYTAPAPRSRDFLEYALPFLALLGETRGERLLPALPDLRQAEKLNPDSALPPYFMGLVYERAGQADQAAAAYRRAREAAPDCYPASLGAARLLDAAGKAAEALKTLQDLVMQFPDNTAIKRQLALSYYHSRDWTRAAPAISEALQWNPRDGEFLLMQAHAAIEQGQILQAVAPLDKYAALDTSSRFYLFLRARVQAEGYRNRDAALTYLRSILRASSADEEAAVYTAGLLLESSRQEERAEGQEMLERFLEAENPSLLVIDMAFRDAARREAWPEAKSYLTRLLRESPEARYLLSAALVERGLGNKEAALSYARQFHEREPLSEDGTLAYVSALIDIGRRSEAGGIIESRLASLSGGPVKARYYYQRSRIRSDEEAAVTDLRSSLFEDPRNTNALVGLLDIYHRRGDERRALYYFKQARSFDPQNAQLRRYERTYGNR